MSVSVGRAVLGRWAGMLGFGGARPAPPRSAPSSSAPSSSAPPSSASSNSAGLDIMHLAQVPPRFYAVGDVHGCSDLYIQLEARLAADAAQHGPDPDETLIVLLGDVIDRGPATAHLLDHLVAPPPAGIRRVVLRGNHEAMFLRFWAAPRLDDAWLGHGGAAMLASYGVDLGDGALARRGRLRQVLDACIPTDHVEFLARTPMALSMPGFILAHAGINPALPLAAQGAHDVLWGDPERLEADMGPQLDPNLDPNLGATVIHGHRPTRDGLGYIGRRRINVDTGAYATGRLTAVEVLDGQAQRFVVAQRGDSS